MGGKTEPAEPPPRQKARGDLLRVDVEAVNAKVEQHGEQVLKYKKQTDHQSERIDEQAKRLGQLSRSVQVAQERLLQRLRVNKRSVRRQLAF